MFQFFFCVYLLAFTIVILAWDFWRLNFGRGIFFGGGLFEALGIFLSFDFCPHSIIPVIEIQSTPPSPPAPRETRHQKSIRYT